MAQTETPFVIGVFRDRALAKQVVDELHHAGFRDDQIWIPGSGTSSGGFLDGVVNKLMGDQHPDNLNALADEGLSKAEVEYYQHELEAGRTLVIVQSHGHQQEARDILNHFGAYNSSTNPSRLEDVHTIQLREEVLQAQKEPVEIGEVFIRKVVVREEKTITVPVIREDIVVERRPISPTSNDTNQSTNQSEGRLIELGENESIRIPLRTEQVLIEKRPVVAEELIVSKRNIQEIRRFSDTVQREEARLERQGNVNIRGDSLEEIPPQNRSELD